MPVERRARDDNVMASMFGIVELQLWISRCIITDDTMETLADRYPSIEIALFLCKKDPAFIEPLDDAETTTDGEMDEDYDYVNEDASSLIVFMVVMSRLRGPREHCYLYSLF